jgi:hypothetical protein
MKNWWILILLMAVVAGIFAWWALRKKPAEEAAGTPTKVQEERRAGITLNVQGVAASPVTKVAMNIANTPVKPPNAPGVVIGPLPELPSNIPSGLPGSEGKPSGLPAIMGAWNLSSAWTAADAQAMIESGAWGPAVWVNGDTGQVEAASPNVPPADIGAIEALCGFTP